MRIHMMGLEEEEAVVMKSAEESGSEGQRANDELFAAIASGWARDEYDRVIVKDLVEQGWSKRAVVEAIRNYRVSSEARRLSEGV